MEETISLQEIISIIKKRFSIILVGTIFGVIAAIIMTFFVITPKYQSQAQLIVRLPQTESANVNDINANLQMITTYKDLIKSDSVMESVQQELKEKSGKEISIEDLRDSITVSQSQNSQMFSIISLNPDSITAENIANQTAMVFQKKAQDILNVDKITIISPAIISEKPVSPNNKLNILIGLVIGAAVGILTAFVLEMFDKSIKDDRYIVEELELMILGIVPKMDAKELAAKVAKTEPNKQVQAYVSKNVVSTNKPISDDNEETPSQLPERKRRSRI